MCILFQDEIDELLDLKARKLVWKSPLVAWQLTAGPMHIRGFYASAPRDKCRFHKERVGRREMLL